MSTKRAPVDDYHLLIDVFTQGMAGPTNGIKWRSPILQKLESSFKKKMCLAFDLIHLLKDSA